MTDGKTVLPLATAQDHKAVGDGDTGPNTGGMGAYSPAPVMTDAMIDAAMRRIIEPTIRGMAEIGSPYRGVLYAGLMITADGPKLIEYNARFGDPECQVLMTRLKSDLLSALIAACDGALDQISLRWRDEAAEHRPRLAAQLLEIPVVDDRAETPSAHYTDTPLWNRTNILDSWSHYLAGRDAATPVSPYAAPARAASLAGLPPSYVGVCTADPLRDEGIEYARRLAHDGVAVELRTYPGLFHGAAGLFPDVPACRRARAALLDAATRLLVS